MIVFMKNGAFLNHPDNYGKNQNWYIGDAIKRMDDPEGFITHIRGISASDQLWLGDNVFVSPAMCLLVEDK